MIFCCSNCKEKLIQTERTYRCPNGHTFDLARQGYINLLRSNNGTSHGDQGIMLQSRRNFLESGFYEPFADELCKLVGQYLCTEHDVILDCGCGEGYYTAKMRSVFPSNPVAGFDVSKKAVSMSASKYKEIDFAVASSRDIPVPDQFVKILTNVFSPMEASEFYRILQPDGFLIYAVPGPRHLWGLKQVIYDFPYENKTQNLKYEGFTMIDRISVRSEINLGSSLLLDLFAMTPYYYRSPRGTVDKLQNISELTTEIEFDFLVYQKNNGRRK